MSMCKYIVKVICIECRFLSNREIVIFILIFLIISTKKRTFKTGFACFHLRDAFLFF